MFQRLETKSATNGSVGARTARIALVCLLLVGCDTASRGSSSHPAGPPTTASEGPTTASVATVVDVQPAGPGITETLDAAGITVDRLVGGEVRVHGQDRWGVPFDSTYADATYFANAAPVLARSLAEPQAGALVALIPRVQAAAAPAPAAP